jgi:hypothetical protein
MKIKMVYDVLSNLGQLYHTMGKVSEAKATREEAYCSISEVYDPEHPLVLEAGTRLIEILKVTKKYYDAERFSRICYESLTRTPLDPDSFQIANAAINLATISIHLIRTKGPEGADIIEADFPVRK